MYYILDVSHSVVQSGGSGYPFR